MAITTPDLIYSPDNTAGIDQLHTELSTMAASVQTALGTRALHTYSWANTAARTAQTGMADGDYGYQRDTKVTYRYNGSTWGYTRHQEATYSVSAPNATTTFTGAFTTDSGNTTETLFTNGTSGIMVVTSAGVYDLTIIMSDSLAAATGRTFINLAYGSINYRASIPVGEDVGLLTIAGLYLPSASTSLTLTVFQTTSGTRTVTGRILMTRR